MKRLIAFLFAVLIAIPAFACGPMTGHSGHTGGTSGGGGSQTKRQKWVKKRIKEIDNRQEAYRAGRLGSKIFRGAPEGALSSQDQIAIQRQYEDAQGKAQKRQHQKEQAELLMLKNEIGQLSPEERAALAKFLADRRTRAARRAARGKSP